MSDGAVAGANQLEQNLVTDEAYLGSSIFRRQLSWEHFIRVGVRLGFGALTKLTDEDVVSVGIITGAETGTVVLVEAEDVLAATEVLLDVKIGPDVPLGMVLGAMKDKLIETVEELEDSLTVLVAGRELVKLAGMTGGAEGPTGLATVLDDKLNFEVVELEDGGLA
jgi:hypothetical protein